MIVCSKIPLPKINNKIFKDIVAYLILLHGNTNENLSVKILGIMSQPQ